MKSLDRAAFVVLLIAVGLWALAGAFLWLRLTTPSDGAYLQPGESYWREDGVVVTPLDARPGSLQPGDVVAAVDGRSLESWAQALFQPDASRPHWQFGQSVAYTVERGGRRIELAVSLGPHPLGAVMARNWSTILFGVVNQLVAAFVFWKRPRDRAAQTLFLGAAGMFGATAWSFGLTLGDIVGGIGFWLFKILTVGAYTLFFVASFHFALAFYNVRVRAPVTLTLYAMPYAFYAVYVAAVRSAAANALDWLRLWIPGEGIVPVILLLGMIMITLYGYRTRRDPIVRRRIRWLVWAMLVSGGGGLVLWLLPDLVLGYKIIDAGALGLIVLPFPLALAAAILRHHLFDIDVILNRTLVYGALTAIVAGTYIFVVGYLGTLFHVSGEAHRTADLVVSLVATGLVAVIFQPLRERLQRAVNRLMYGERDDPYAVLSRLGQRLKATLAPEAVLPTIVETVAQALKLPCVAIALKEGNDFRIVAASPPSPPTPLPLGEGRRGEGGEAQSVPLIYQGEIVGQLIFSPRAPGEAFTAAERRLLEDIAHQAGVAVHAERLTADLQRARERLVTAREEERRRLRRDLHDELGPALASQGLKLAAVQKLMPRDPETAHATVEDLLGQNGRLMADIRRLVYALRPPALDELGLVEAIRDRGRGIVGDAALPAMLRLSVEAPPAGLPPLPAAVEVAAYRIALEAMTNVARHAQARHCVVRFVLDEGPGMRALRLEIADDGAGLPGQVRAGVGLSSMRERAEELGGTFGIESAPETGTRVRACLPIAREGQA